MPDIRLHPTADQHAARMAATEATLRHVEGRIRAYESTLTMLLAERAITATAYEPVNIPGEAARWLILADNGLNRPGVFAYWGELEWLGEPTLDWLEGMAEHGDDDGRHPIVQLDDETGDLIRRAWRIQRRHGVEDPLQPFPTGTVEEIRVLDRLSDPLLSIQIAWGTLLDAEIQRQVSAMIQADEPRMSPDGAPIPLDRGER